jgi:CelD/BcsL family acetyltransferase involved in cellulose biosynthesis
MYARAVTGAATLVEPACPEAASTGGGVGAADSGRRFRVEQQPVASISPRSWDTLAAANPWATPFSRSAFQRAWWDAYGTNALDVTLVVLEDGGGRPSDDGSLGRPSEAGQPSEAGEEPIVAILPLMCRSAGQAADGDDQAGARPGQPFALTPAKASATTLFMGASYHADYATVLTEPENLAATCQAITSFLATTPPGPSWDAIDLRRLRCGDPAADALAAAFGASEISQGWTLNVEREDVCPVTTIPRGADFDGFLNSLGTKDRHEIRRKMRRAEAAGEVRFDVSREPLGELDAFIDLHQARWADRGLFPPTPGGQQSRRFLRRLFELSGPDGDARLTFLSVGGRRIASGIHFETPDAILYYNAGLDPGALDLSPGVLLIAAYVKLAIETGRSRLDFLRGNESYKYQWGAVDEPVSRLLVRRTATIA